MNRIDVIKNRPEWKNTRKGIWHKFTNGKSWGQIYYERTCPVCKCKFAASTMHVKYCSNNCHSSIFQLEEKSHRWTGGKIASGKGYILILKRDHPFAAKPNFYIPEHRIIMEEILGRYLKKNEAVHHINGIKHDNRPENLIVLTHSEHAEFHNWKRKQFSQNKQQKKSHS